MTRLVRGFCLRCCLLCALFLPLWTAAAPADMQGWSVDDHRDWYRLSQGSQLVPASWLRALERPCTKSSTPEPPCAPQSFLFDSLARFGYLPRHGSKGNELPIGFVEDTGWGSPTTFVGMNCAACHTSEIRHNGTAVRIHGGPTDADLYAFLAELDKALAETSARAEKFERFTKSVLGKRETPAKRRQLEKQLAEFVEYFRKFVSNSTPASPWGRARQDAFGMIFNRVTSIDLCIDDNSRPPNAPVSYPFLWSTHWHDVTQWNGSAPNDRFFHWLPRNIGQVLGVFGKIDLGRRDGYPSTPRQSHLGQLERILSKLKAPSWPAGLFGKLDEDKVRLGKAVYEARKCGDCHKVVPADQQGRRAEVRMVPLDQICTDPAMVMAAGRETGEKRKTGILEGVLEGIVTGNPFGPEAPALTIVQNAVIGAILGRFHPDPLGPCPTVQQAGIQNQSRDFRFKALATTQAAELFAAFQEARLDGYKARPLNGIWATAPFLHNGSVPTLDALLRPVEKRPAKFWVGSREFDPEKVGFVSTPGIGTELDTSLAGNRNTGHEGSAYGTDMSEGERAALIEYLKSL